MLFRPIHAFLNLMRDNAKLLESYDAYDEFRELIPDDNIRAKILRVFVDLLTEYVIVANEWEIPNRCQFDVETLDPRSRSECGEPAAYRLFWGKEELWVCEDHFDLLREGEPDELVCKLF